MSAESSSRRHFLKKTGAFLATSALPALAATQQTGKGKTVLLKSAWDTVNIGDIGHTPGTLRILEQHLPDAHVILWAAKLNEQVESMLRRRFPKVEILQGHPAKDDERGRALQDAFKRADVCIHNSGMGTDTSFMAYCRKLGKPYGLYGQSYFRTVFDGADASTRKELLNHAAFIYCRETHTLETLRNADITTPVLEFGPDGCFGIDVRDDARADAFMKKAGLEDRKFITIQLRTHTAKHKGVHNPPLNPLHPTPEQVADDERRAAVYREIITLWVRKMGYKVLISPEVMKEMEHNKRLLYDRLPVEIQSHVVNLDTFWNADEAASIFARAHTVVCHEPHSPIIALANGTPIIHTYSEFHSPKCWMFKDIGLSDWLLEFDSTPAAKTLEVLLAIEADYPAAQAKVKTAMEYVHERQASSMRVVAKVMGV